MYFIKILSYENNNLSNKNIIEIAFNSIYSNDTN